MSNSIDPEKRWQKVSHSLRTDLPEDSSSTLPEEKPPPGFATRVVALSQEKKPFSLSSLGRPYLAGAALLTILGTGIGAGVGIGRLSAPETIALPSHPVPSESLALEMEQSLRQTLSLTTAQEAAIAPDLAGFNADVIDNRRLALFHYYQSLLDLHDRIDPKLEPEQQNILRKNRSLLQSEIEQRFPDLQLKQ